MSGCFVSSSSRVPIRMFRSTRSSSTVLIRPLSVSPVAHTSCSFEFTGIPFRLFHFAHSDSGVLFHPLQLFARFNLPMFHFDHFQNRPAFQFRRKINRRLNFVKKSIVVARRNFVQIQSTSVENAVVTAISSETEVAQMSWQWVHERAGGPPKGFN